MIRSAIFSLFVVGVACGQNPELAVVQIPTHGCSAVVIKTMPGKTYLLGPSHMFMYPENRNKRMKFVIPVDDRVKGDPRRGYRVLKVGPKRMGMYTPDLVLIEYPWGPVPFVCPVAPPGHRPPSQVMSAGYDSMKIFQAGRPQTFTATIRQSSANWTYTSQRPWKGRSGGGLIDQKNGYLIGIVSGWDNVGSTRGLGRYVSHSAILRFLSGTPAAVTSARGSSPYRYQVRSGVPRQFPSPTPVSAPRRPPVGGNC